MRGRTVPLSLERRLVVDFMRFSMGVPVCTEALRIDVSAVAAARAQSAARPRWMASFRPGRTARIRW